MEIKEGRKEGGCLKLMQGETGRRECRGIRITGGVIWESREWCTDGKEDYAWIGGALINEMRHGNSITGFVLWYLGGLVLSGVCLLEMFKYTIETHYECTMSCLKRRIAIEDH